MPHSVSACSHHIELRFQSTKNVHFKSSQNGHDIVTLLKDSQSLEDSVEVQIDCDFFYLEYKYD